MANITIDFEHSGNFITAKENGQVIIRCNFKYTDCGEEECLDLFIQRHFGVEQTAKYLHECYKNNK